MITIRNISPSPSPFGWHDYEVRINNGPVIATFSHKREDGLARCLAKAASAVEKAKWEEAGRLMEALQK